METEVWDFSRPGVIRSLESQIEDALAKLRRDPMNMAAARKIGEWYEYRGAGGWAADMLAKPRTAGSTDDSVRIARCYWLAGDAESAAAEARRIVEKPAAASAYGRLIAELILANQSVPKAFTFHDDAMVERRWSRTNPWTWRETLDGVPQADFQIAGGMTAMGKPGALFIEMPARPAETVPSARPRCLWRAMARSPHCASVPGELGCVRTDCDCPSGSARQGSRGYSRSAGKQRRPCCGPRSGGHVPQSRRGRRIQR